MVTDQSRGENKRALILLNMGAPLSLDEVTDYLFQIFSDRDIIRFPGGRLMQPFFAWMISRLRSKKVQARYQLIGGSSPQLKYALSQKANLATALDAQAAGLTIFIGMRYAQPFIDKAIHQAYQEGFREFIFLPLYPHYCLATTGSAFKAAKAAISNYSDVAACYINDFHDFPGYIDLLKAYLQEHLTSEETLLFSAHSIPRAFVDEGDPYVDQVKQTCALAAGERDYHLAFQSRTGPVEWVGPDTVQEAKRLSGDNRKLFIVPVSFVSDHIETLYEIDIELKEHLSENSRARLRRMPMFNDDVRFGNMLAELVLKKNLND